MYTKRKLIILSILFTPNNILYSLTCLKGKVLFWTSPGSKKIKNTKKITTTSLGALTKDMAHFISNSGYSYVFVKIKGFNRAKKTVIKYLKQSSINILAISEKTTFPHNGCKRSKIRRI